MTTHALRFQSPGKICGLPMDSGPQSAMIDQWRVSESYERGKPTHLGSDLGTYHLVLEKEISARQQIWTELDDACRLASQLDFAWCYVAGTPYLAVRWGLGLREAPEHWIGNLREIDVAFCQELGSGYCEAAQVVSQQETRLPFFPLQKVVAVREANLAAPPEIRELIWRHVQSHKSLDGQLFFLANALELARGFFPGPTREDRTEQLQKEMATIGVEAHLTQNVSWLFEIANTRSDIRHVVASYPPVLTLHPRLTGQERQDFVYNADLVLRAFICHRLGVDLVLINN